MAARVVGRRAPPALTARLIDTWQATGPCQPATVPPAVSAVHSARPPECSPGAIEPPATQPCSSGFSRVPAIFAPISIEPHSGRLHSSGAQLSPIHTMMRTAPLAQKETERHQGQDLPPSLRSRTQHLRAIHRWLGAQLPALHATPGSHVAASHPAGRQLMSQFSDSLRHPFPPPVIALSMRLSSASEGLLRLNELRPAPGSVHGSKRLGRGMGSGKGKTAGRGHKGQKSRSGNKPRIGFEGGQTPLRLRLPKRGFHNRFSLDFQVVNLKDIVEKVEDGAIDPSSLITMKTLKEAGLGGKATRDGIKLLARGADAVKVPLHFEVSRVSETAKSAVVAAGGTVTRVHYNKLGLRALLKPEWFEKKGRLLPRPARPPPRIQRLGLVDATGRLPAPTTPASPLPASLP